MPFSIKSEQADALLAEVRALTGEGITDAVINSLTSRLEKLRSERAELPSEFLHRFWQEHPQFLMKPGDPELSTSFNDWMYDDDGLPK